VVFSFNRSWEKGQQHSLKNKNKDVVKARLFEVQLDFDNLASCTSSGYAK
jgi:hypothetical protein